MSVHSLRSTSLVIRGARENNLKNVDVEIPREQLVVITGLSGSGKSSLAFETIYAEGQRRFLESLSAYARRRVEQVKKPDVDHVYGLSPVVSIEQKTVGRNPRSTIGTMTDIYDYLRVLYSTAGQGHCPYCREPIPTKSPHQIAEHLLSLPEGTTGRDPGAGEQSVRRRLRLLVRRDQNARLPAHVRRRRAARPQRRARA